MHTIYLHIGSAKTGASAIQGWLEAHRTQLERDGFLLPQAPKPQVCNGNYLAYFHNAGTWGRQLVEAAPDDERPEEMLRRLWKGQEEKDIILTWAAFYGFSQKALARLSLAFQRCQARVKVSYFVRDLYDYYYSLYNQYFKRRGFTFSFADYILHAAGKEELCYPESEYGNLYTDPLQAPFRFQQLYGLESFTVRHYNAIKQQGSAAAFAEILGLDPQKYPAPRIPINPSLSAHHVEILRRILQKVYGQYSMSPAIKGKLVRFLSMFYLALPPDMRQLKGGIPFEPHVYIALERQYQKHIEAFNQAYNINLCLLDASTPIITPKEFEDVYVSISETLAQEFLSFLASLQE